MLADASPEGYREITRIATFEQGDYATPTFVDGYFLVRNLDAPGGGPGRQLRDASASRGRGSIPPSTCWAS